MIVKIREDDYTLVYDVWTLVIFERITNRAFEGKTITDWATLAYASILSGNRDMTLSMDEFFREDPSILNTIVDWLKKQFEISKQLRDEESDDASKKK